MKAKIFVEAGRDGYQDRNAVREYLVGDGSAQPAGIATMPETVAAASSGEEPSAVPTPAAVGEDEIPF